MPVSKCPKDLVVRRWDDPSSWLETVNGVTTNYLTADSAVIPCTWIMKVLPDSNGESRAEKRNITVYGDLVFENPTNIFITTESLNIHGGTLSIGS